VNNGENVVAIRSEARNVLYRVIYQAFSCQSIFLGYPLTMH
jgi:hypothetical protein